MKLNKSLTKIKKNDIYKDNPSDIIVSFINLCDNKIFNKMINKLNTFNMHIEKYKIKFGKYCYNDNDFIVINLENNKKNNILDKNIIEDLIYFLEPTLNVIIVDNLSIKNINMILELLEISNNSLICILDKSINSKIDIDKFSDKLNIPIINPYNASDIGLIKNKIYIHLTDNKNVTNKILYNDEIESAINTVDNYLKSIISNNTRWLSIKLLSDDKIYESLKENLNYDIYEDKTLLAIIENEKSKFIDIKKEIIKKLVLESERIYIKSVTINNVNYNKRDRKIDKILTSKLTGIPIMLLLFGFIFWLTIVGANYPSELLSNVLFKFESILYNVLSYLNIPIWIKDPVVYGIYRTLAWVISVMLPPMAIFFPLFTLLEDSGYLPRIAFNMDNLFNKCSSNGKQSLTMCMGFGCNACGVVGSRIIDSKRERLIAILTNNFVPCNGRFPTLITLIAIFFTTSTITSSLLLVLLIMLGIIATLLVSKLLSKTILKGMPSSFILELPPYRKPQIGKVIVRSIFDRTLYVLGRAIVVAAPMGLVIWLLSNISINGISMLKNISDFLNPFANIFGLDGVIMLSFILGFPANEIVIPIAIMTYMQESMLTSLDISSLKLLLIDNGWTIITALSTMIFCLFHFPCGTTCLTIKKESGSIKWMILSIILPTIIGLTLCFIINILSYII